MEKNKSFELDVDHLALEDHQLLDIVSNEKQPVKAPVKEAENAADPKKSETQAKTRTAKREEKLIESKVFDLLRGYDFDPYAIRIYLILARLAQQSTTDQQGFFKTKLADLIALTRCRSRYRWRQIFATLEGAGLIERRYQLGDRGFDLCVLPPQQLLDQHADVLLRKHLISRAKSIAANLLQRLEREQLTTSEVIAVVKTLCKFEDLDLWEESEKRAI